MGSQEKVKQDYHFMWVTNLTNLKQFNPQIYKENV